jgi:hypothetical protein
MTDPNTSERYRWLAAVREREARRERTKALRAELTAARAAGLRARHAAKEARTRREAPPVSTKPCGCSTDRLCPQHEQALDPTQRRAYRREALNRLQRQSEDTTARRRTPDPAPAQDPTFGSVPRVAHRTRGRQEPPR